MTRQDKVEELYLWWRVFAAAGDNAGMDVATAQLRKRGVPRYPWGELEPDEKKRRFDNEARARNDPRAQTLFDGNGRRRK